MEQQIEQPQGAAEVDGRVAVNRDEELVAAWLGSQGYAVRHLTNGEDPPDLVVDGNVAVEVTTIASYAGRSIWDFMEGVCRSLGAAENGRGYLISWTSENEALLQDGDRSRIAAIKRELRHLAKIALGNHYRNPHVPGPAGEPPDFLPRNGLVRLTHGVSIRISGPIQDNQNVKYKVAVGDTKAVWLVSHLIEAIEAAILKKTSNRMIQKRADNYTEWWLVVTDPSYSRCLSLDEVRAIAEATHYSEPWRRILLANTWGDRVDAVHCLTQAGN